MDNDLTKKKIDLLIDLAKEAYPEEFKIQQQVIDCVTDYFSPEFVDVQNKPFKAGITSILNSTVWDLAIHAKEDEMCTQFRELQNYILADIEDLDVFKKLINISYVKETISFSLLNKTVFIRFPNVHITNEESDSVDITELYVAIDITEKGCIFGNRSVRMTRSEYTESQFLAGYTHSHLPRVNGMPRFEVPCFGTGPIGDTFCKLIESSDLDTWGLFCFELETYVQHESLSGGPYIGMSSIGTSDKNISTNLYYNTYPGYDASKNLLDDFMSYYCKTNKIPITYVNGQYMLGCSNLDFILSLSNAFIEWYNEQFRENKYFFTEKELSLYSIAKSYIVYNNQIFNNDMSENIENISYFEGKQLFYNDTPFTFKEKPVKLHIETSDALKEAHTSILLTVHACSYIATKILRIINEKFHNQPKYFPSHNEVPVISCRKR